MNTAVSPIATTTSLSVLLHGVAVVALLVINNQTTSDEQAVGKGLDVELISSIITAEQLETDIPAKQKAAFKDGATISAEAGNVSKKLSGVPVISSESENSLVLAEETVEQNRRDVAAKHNVQNVFESDGVMPVLQSTNANAQRHSILELLHSRISSNKEYPYLARRHRRQGVATVAFVLHPDGRIENTHMISSSQVVSLDRAAVSAVNSIQPFVVAKDYLQQAKEFHVDVVFDLL